MDDWKTRLLLGWLIFRGKLLVSGSVRVSSPTSPAPTKKRGETMSWCQSKGTPPLALVLHDQHLNHLWKMLTSYSWNDICQQFSMQLAELNPRSHGKYDYYISNLHLPMGWTTESQMHFLPWFSLGWTTHVPLLFPTFTYQSHITWGRSYGRLDLLECFNPAIQTGVFLVGD